LAKAKRIEAFRKSRRGGNDDKLYRNSGG